MRRWTAGDTVVVRNVWRNKPWVAMAAVVVRDEPDFLALYVSEGAPFAFAPVGPFPHTWESRSGWEGPGVLMLHRPEDPYAVWVFWDGPERTFSRWYVNFQTSLTRSRTGFDMLDHELDLWSSDGETWNWKDDELLDQRVTQELFTADEAAAIRAKAERVHEELQSQGMWWDPAWAEWSPDPDWPLPRLPNGWEIL